MSFGNLLKDVKSQIRETDVETLRKTVEAQKGKTGNGNGAGPILIDVREKDEWVEGLDPRRALDSARHAGAADRGPGPREVVRDRPLLRGRQPLGAGGADARASSGYTNVKSLAGGFTAWKRAGLSFDRPFIMTQEQSLRYARHMMLPEVGEAGQTKLLSSKVLLLGAGGLGSPVGLYLAAAGVGTIGFVDDDVVDASNLQRQIIHSTDRVGMPKVESAANAISELNPDVKVIQHKVRLDVGERPRHHQGLRPHRRRRPTTSRRAICSTTRR